LRDRIAAAWRAEDFTTAGDLIPDELLDAFMLCGTREDVAAGAMVFHAQAGLQLPLLQPVLQDDHQIDELIAAAAIFASIPGTEAATSTQPQAVAAATAMAAAGAPTGSTTLSLAGDRQLGLGDRFARRAGTAYEILRPFAFTASIIPVLAGASLAWVHQLWDWPAFIACLLGGVLLHAGTNVVNEVYDVRKGIDTITSPRASHAIVKGRISEHAALLFAGGAFALAVVVGVYLAWLRGPAIVGLGVVGLIAGWGYTAPPLEYKNRALGVPLVFLLMGPLMVEGSYFAVSGTWSLTALVLSMPVGLLVAAILHGNEWRDIREDSRAGISTLSARIGRRWAHYGYVGLVLGAYMVLAVSVIAGILPAWTMLAILSLPFLAQVIRSAELGATGQARAIAMIDLQTARLHLAFGSLLVAGLVLSRLVGA
ncbi:MAG: UbiA family prenyltransferase, partial [Candidatus Limnocylindrales bacterium]